STAAATATVAEKAQALGKLLDEIKLDRDKAEQTLNNALQHFTDAASAAEQLQREVKPRMDEAQRNNAPQLPALRMLLEIMHPSMYQLQQAVVQHMLGTLNLSHAADARARSRMIQGL